MDQKYLSEDLLYKYKTGTCTEEERAIVESWHIRELLQSNFMPDEAELNRAGKEIWAALPLHERNARKPLRLWSRIAVAASILLCIAAGLFFYQDHEKEKAEDLARIVPGGSKAVLTLADGREISLSDAANGKLASQSGMAVTKAKDGQLVYQVLEQSTGITDTPEPAYNTISTPRGGMYQIRLPDGTKVWLNSASSLKYPTRFKGKERSVELQGEGYFEVKRNEAMPFKVVSGHQTVLVLGTHFNINAYGDEADIKTTLLEGKVSIGTGTMQKVLKPGDQAMVKAGDIKIAAVVPEDAIAWVDNTFLFNQEELGSICRKISRWYDVNIICPPELEKLQYNGVVSRAKNIQQALRVVELTGDVHFRIEGRRITVMR